MDSGIRYKGLPIERVTVFKYLGSMMEEDGGLDAEIAERCRTANNAFYSVPQELWRDMSIPLHTKYQLLKSLVLTKLFYGAEAWVPTVAELAPLETQYYTFLRIIGGYREQAKWEHRQGAEYREASRVQVLSGMLAPTPEEILREARLRLWGQVVRAGPDSLLRRMALMTPWREERLRGAEKTSWYAMVCGDLGLLEKGVFYDEMDCYVPSAWRKICHTQRRGPVPEPPFGGPYGIYETW